MAWLPDHIWLKQKAKGQGKGKGKGKGKAGVMNMVMNMMRKGGGKGKGGGKRRSNMIGGMLKKDQDRVVWIGGFKEREAIDRDLNKQFQEFINKKAEGCKYVNIGRKGSASAIFGSGDEASNAISALNGIKFKGQVLEFDVWEKQEN